MSVALMISATGATKAEIYVPVAAQDTFVTLWLPYCKSLGLQFMPLFETGITVEHEHVDQVIDEFLRIKEVAQQNNTSLAQINMVKRIDRVVEELVKARGRADLDIWIG
jgi:hypothetical protein